jgi:hypothetical protein
MPGTSGIPEPPVADEQNAGATSARFVENLPFLRRFSVTSKLIRALNSVQASTIQQVEAFR